MLSSAAWAHNFLAAPSGAQTTLIPDISVSRAAYRTLSEAGQVDVYQFTAKKGQEIFIQMTVPLLERERGFAPEMALVYTGLGDATFADPKLEKGVLVDPPHDVVDRLHPHTGADQAEPPLIGVACDGSAPQPFNEPFTGTRYWIRQTFTVSAPADGTYRLAVYSTDGSTGKYVLAPGTKEKFGFKDLLTFESVRLTVRQFCEVPVWPEITIMSILGAAVLTAAGFGIAALVMM